MKMKSYTFKILILVGFLLGGWCFGAEEAIAHPWKNQEEIDYFKAVAYKASPFKEEHLKERWVKTLLNKPNKFTIGGRTTLHMAADSNNYEMAKTILIYPQINPFLRYNDSETPLDIARKKGHQEIANLIKQKMLEQQKVAIIESFEAWEDKPTHYKDAPLPDEIASIIASQSIE